MTFYALYGKIKKVPSFLKALLIVVVVVVLFYKADLTVLIIRAAIL